MIQQVQTAKAFIPRDYDIFSGLDVDKKSMSITFKDHQEMKQSMRIPYSSHNPVNYTRKHFANQKVAFVYEAGPTGYGLYEDLTREGYCCLVVAPSMVPMAPGKHVKTNRLDSIKLAEGLRGGQLKSIYVPSASYRHLRHLVGLRDTFVRQATADKCRIKALLLFEGIGYPAEEGGSQWSKTVIQKLKELLCADAVCFKLNQLISNLEFAQKQTRETMKEIHRFCEADSGIKRCIGFLKSIPGVGAILATHLLARIGGWKHLKNVRQLAGFFGLGTREDSTGDSIRRGSITCSGDSRLVKKLIQGAWTAIRLDPEMREFYRRIYGRHPKPIAAKKAIVAVARKMTTRIYTVLYEQRDYVVRHEISSATLTQEETVCPRERLEYIQNHKDSPCDDSLLKTESPGPSVALDEAHLKTV